jgi:hypothetical protein
MACASPVEVVEPPGPQMADAGKGAMPEAGKPDAQNNDAGSDAGCEASTCNGACVDLMNDYANCGSCGHDCFGGVCTAGVCQPGSLGWGVTDVLALDTTNVYWSVYNPSEILECAKGGCSGNPTSLWKDGGWSIVNTNLAFDANDVYWIMSSWSGSPFTNKLVRCAKSGCNNTPTTVYEETSATAGQFFLAVDANDVYWTDSNQGTVRKCAIGGCNNTATTLASGLTSPRSIRIDQANVYWSTLDASGAVMKCAKTGCNGTPVTFGSSQNWTISIAIDGANVYWGNYTGGEINKCALGGCGGNPSTLASSQHPWAVAADATDVYWSDLIGGTIFKCGLGGCNGMPKTVVDKQKGPGAIVVDSKAIYWATQGTGGVMVLAK